MSLNLNNLRELTRSHTELASYLDDDDPSREAILALGAAVGRLAKELDSSKAENERLLYENRALFAEQPKMQRDAWGEGYADGRDDTLEGVPGATSNPYTEEA